MPELSKKIRYLLFPLALFYWGVLFWRNLFYTIGFFVTGRLPVPVISVGNLSIGGTGKTPMVIYLAEKLKKMGKKVAIVSRGYKRRTSGTVVVTDGKSVHVSWKEVGDEPYLMATRLKEISIVVDEVRYRGGLVAVEKFNPDVILLDDAFQHRPLERDLDIVLLNSQDPPEVYKLLPYGKLREPWFHLRRADFIFWTKANLRPPHPITRAKVLQSKVPTFNSWFKIRQFLRDAQGNDISVDKINGIKAFAFCGIADPDSFHRLLGETGVDIVGFQPFEDHHDYSQSEVRTMVEDAESNGAKYLITTDKDIFKIGPLVPSSAKVYSLGISFVPSRKGEKALWNLINEKLHLST